MTRLSSMTGGFSGFAKLSGSFGSGSLPPEPIPNGQSEYIAAGTYSWVAPANVTEVSVVCIGGGGGGVYSAVGVGGAGGGSLRYKNAIPVVPGQSYTVVVGAGGLRGSSRGGVGGPSYFMDTSTCFAKGGGGAVARGTTVLTEPTGTNVGDGGGDGAVRSGGWSTQGAGGGGGAGGYSGPGGAGGSNSDGGYGYGGAGGGGGSGGGGLANQRSGGGGGVGIYGQTNDGNAGAKSSNHGYQGGGGSGGAGSGGTSNATQSPSWFGGGAGGYDNNSAIVLNGYQGAVRLIWGENRAYPSTNTGNLT